MPLKPRFVCVSRGETRLGCSFFTYGLVKMADGEENKLRSTANISGEGLTAQPAWVSHCWHPLHSCPCPSGLAAWRRQAKPLGALAAAAARCCAPAVKAAERVLRCVKQRKPLAGVTHLGLSVLPGCPPSGRCPGPGALIPGAPACARTQPRLWCPSTAPTGCSCTAPGEPRLPAGL